MRRRPSVASWVGKVIRAMQHVVVAVLEKTVPATQVAGLSVLDLLPEDGRQSDRLSVLSEALELVQVHHPRLYRRIERELRRVVFLDSGPEYWPQARACVLDDIHQQSAIATSCQLVHEATHGRLWRRGFRYSEAERPRIERICVAAELELLDRVPGGDTLRARTETKLSQPWWTTEEIRARRRDVLKSVKTGRKARGIPPT